MAGDAGRWMGVQVMQAWRHGTAGVYSGDTRTALIAFRAVVSGCS